MNTRDWINEGSAGRVKAQLTDADHVPLGTGDVTALTFTLYNKATAAFINSRNAVNILNTGGGTVTPEKDITDATQTDPVVLTVVGHGLRDEDYVYVYSVGGMIELNKRRFNVRVVSDDEIELVGENGEDYAAYTSGGAVKVGLVEMLMTAADAAIVNSALSAGKKETHVARFMATIEGGTVIQEVEFDVKQLAAPA